MTQVFAAFSSDSVALVRAWAESWSAHGWTPRLLSSFEIRKAGTKKQAVRRRGGGLLTDGLTFNFGLGVHPVRGVGVCTRATRWGQPGWRRAVLVKFPPHTPEEKVRERSRWR